MGGVMTDKQAATFFSVLWLSWTGLFAGWAVVLLGAITSEALRFQLFCVFAYIVFGLGPVLGVILRMRKIGKPLSRAALIGLGLLCALSPIVMPYVSAVILMLGSDVYSLLQSF
jgi:hypothetical protein